ncbi:hypothetical protein QF026_008286 [Streptomyces aurantiacus]|nr:hypothetical protein [Streptomyces aurantiacus]MDQ0779820.1 hypothetical protein [Streptomyces aurantiacus]
MKALEKLLRVDALTVTGKSVGDHLPDRAGSDPSVSSTVKNPFRARRGRPSSGATWHPTER